MDILPAIDLLGGKAVRLLQGRYDQVTDYGDPLAIAKRWSGLVPRLHVVDLEGAKAGAAVQRDLVKALVDVFDGAVQVGGGVRSLATAEQYLELGVERVVMGTVAIRDPEVLRSVVSKFPGRVVVALDAKAGQVATDGWLDVSSVTAVEVAQRFAEEQVAAVLYTDIERDGTEVGPNVEATRTLAERGGLPVIASGGVGTLEHLQELVTVSGSGAGIVGAIVGRALHEGRFSLEQAVEAVRAVTTP